MVPTMLFAIVLSLLAATPATYATPGSGGHDILLPQTFGKPLHTPERRENLQKRYSKLVARQSPPPITTDPDCNLYDGYFYVTPRNYTWQLQCANSYGGNMIVQTTDTTDLGSCISECVNYNRANTPGACVAVTFSGSFSTADTACTQFSSVTDVFLASEEGGAVNSALLILGPDGEIFATPQAEPSFSGAPTQPPNSEPVPSQSTTSVDVTTTSMPPLVSSSVSVSISYGISTTTTTSTSTITITSCLPGQICQPDSTSSGPGTLGGSSSQASQTTSASSINISDGGSRPATTTSEAAYIPSSTTTGAFTFDAGQRTFTTVMPFTEYRVQIIEICAATPTPCSQSTSTATNIVYRTEISCSPGTCIGVVPTTGWLVDAIAAATCLVVS